MKDAPKITGTSLAGYTREQIEQMPASAGLDELVAAVMRPKPTGLPSYKEEGKVAGPWKVVHVGAGVLAWRATRNYSTSIVDAWGVVEFMQAGGWGHGHTVHFPVSEPPAGWLLPHWTFYKRGLYGGNSADTAPLAICRAALLALLEAPAAAAPTTEGTER